MDELLYMLVSTGGRGDIEAFRAAVARPLVVTRHKGLVQYLQESGLYPDGAEVVAHVTDQAVIDGRVVIGVLPLHLACRALAVVEVPLVGLTPADRAAGDLPVERVRELAGAPVVYTVRRLGTLPAGK